MTFAIRYRGPLSEDFTACARYLGPTLDAQWLSVCHCGIGAGPTSTPDFKSQPKAISQSSWL